MKRIRSFHITSLSSLSTPLTQGSWRRWLVLFLILCLWPNPFAVCLASFVAHTPPEPPLPTKAAAAATAKTNPATVVKSAEESEGRKIAKQAVKNLWSICTHLRNPDLYSTAWADACLYDRDNNILLTSRAVQAGEILSLYPCHAVGLTGSAKHHDFLVYNADKDGDCFRAGPTSFRYNIPLLDRDKYPYACLPNRYREALFIDVNAKRTLRPGWLGHLASPGKGQDVNCIVVPLAGAAPLCALVATRDLQKNEALRRMKLKSAHSGLAMEELVAEQTAVRYAHAIAELRSYTDMAYTPDLLAAAAALETATAAQEKNGKQEPTKSSASLPSKFYELNRNYPGLELVHKDPDIYVIRNFLTFNECDRLIAKAEPNLTPCLTKSGETGIVGAAASRTSTNTNVPTAEVPTIVNKLKSLLNVTDERRLETFQVLRYIAGQHFQPHTDGFEGPVTACGFENSARLATVFVYLNHVEKGGATRFNKLGLDIRPAKGMAVVHFPNTLDMHEDTRTEHEGMPAIDDKWLLVTWLWKNVRTDPRYSEEQLQPLSTDKI